MGLIVGTLLIVINQGDRLLEGPWDQILLWKVALTPLVPFFVSLFSGYLASKQLSGLKSELALCKRELQELKQE